MPVKLYNLYTEYGNSFNKTLPEVLTSLTLDYSIMVDEEIGKLIRKLPIGEEYCDRYFMIRRVK